MSLGKGRTPAAPDYTRLAEATAAGNQENVMLQAGLNRPTEINPYGSRQWALREGADPNNPQPGDWVVADSLSPNQQNILNSRENIQLGMGGAAQSSIGRLQQMMGSGVNTAGLPSRYGSPIPNSEEAFSADRKRLEDALYGRQTRFYDQQFGEEDAATRSRLSNAGLMEGSEAYDKAIRDLNQRKDAAYGDAAARAVEMGGSEQSRAFGNLLSAVSASDATRGNALNEELTLRQLPINELNALLGGTQVGGQGGGASFAQGGLAAGPDYMGAGNAQYQAGLDRYNARAAGVGGLVNAGTQLGGAYMLAGLSDRRLKSNVEKVAMHPTGLTVYEYDLLGNRERGFMADEVELVMPEAVMVGEDGYKRVNYGMLGGRP